MHIIAINYRHLQSVKNVKNDVNLAKYKENCLLLWYDFASKKEERLMQSLNLSRGLWSKSTSQARK